MGIAKHITKQPRRCLNCGEVYNISVEKNANQHKTTSNCPKYLDGNIINDVQG